MDVGESENLKHVRRELQPCRAPVKGKVLGAHSTPGGVLIVLSVCMDTHGRQAVSFSRGSVNVLGIYTLVI